MSSTFRNIIFSITSIKDSNHVTKIVHAHRSLIRRNNARENYCMHESAKHTFKCSENMRNHFCMKIHAIIAAVKDAMEMPAIANL